MKRPIENAEIVKTHRFLSLERARQIETANFLDCEAGMISSNRDHLGTENTVIENRQPM